MFFHIKVLQFIWSQHRHVSVTFLPQIFTPFRFAIAKPTVMRKGHTQINVCLDFKMTETNKYKVTLVKISVCKSLVYSYKIYVFCPKM
jgi:hypothetical protein